MLCNICNKNQATVHLTEIVDEEMTELHLCEECAREKSMQMEQQFGLSDLLAGLSDFGKNVESKDLTKIQCPNCKLTYGDFKKIGRLGCSNCYSYFARYLIPLLKRIHGSVLHTGKFPRVTVKTEAIKEVETKIRTKPGSLQLKEKLQEAIRLENFEEAAKLRDKIRELESKGSNLNKFGSSIRSAEKRKKSQ